MKKALHLTILLFGITFYGQTDLAVESRLNTLTKKQEKMEKQLSKLEEKQKFKTPKASCLQANGPDLEESKTQIKYGTPLCIEVLGVNTFLMKTYSTYTPINFDFSTKGFLDIKIPEAKLDASITSVKDEKKSSKVVETFNEKIWNSNEIFDKNVRIDALKLKMITEGINDIDRQKIENLEKEIADLKAKSKELDDEIKRLTKDNEKLKKQYDSIFNIVTQTQKFKDEFKNFQKHFLHIDKYTTLKSTLLKQIHKDSIFIDNVKNFQTQSSSSYDAVYANETEHLKQKTRIVDELSALESSYLNLISIYQQLNTLNKNNELKLSGELKDGKNTLKFDKIIASFETKYLFQDEMKKVKVINDSLIKSKNRTKIIEESYAGIDLYDEIRNASFTSKIISKNIYDDKAEITPQLKNSKGKVMYEYPMVKVSSYGNLKVNGSAGYFLNFISDDNYQLRKKVDSDATSKEGVSESNTNTLKHSLGGLLHAYYNFNGTVDAGLSVGLSINDDANAGFYLGASAFFTESNRLVLTTGVSFIKVKRLNTSNLALNSTTGNYDFSNATDTEIKYDDVYKPSFFIGITYNLFSK